MTKNLSNLALRNPPVPNQIHQVHQTVEKKTKIIKVVELSIIKKHISLVITLKIWSPLFLVKRTSSGSKKRVNKIFPKSLPDQTLNLLWNEKHSEQAKSILLSSVTLTKKTARQKDLAKTSKTLVKISEIWRKESTFQPQTVKSILIDLLKASLLPTMSS
jgi:hypothetical protein